MATLPAVRTVRALTCGLGLAGALLTGPVPEQPTVSASTFNVAADDPGQPSPDPAPNAQGPGDDAPPQAMPHPHKRHIDNDPVFRR